MTGIKLRSSQWTLRLAEVDTRLFLRPGVEAEHPKLDTGVLVLGRAVTSLLASLVWPQTCGDVFQGYLGRISELSLAHPG